MDFSAPTYHDDEIHEEVPDTRVDVLSYNTILPTGEDRLVFDLINVPAAYANALRRTLLAGVPSMAIDSVSIDLNTGVMPDEVLSHRLGLIPINANPDHFEYQDAVEESEGDNHQTAIVFGLHVIGGDGPDPNLEGVDFTWETELPPFYTGPDGIVMSRHLVWMPLKDQEHMNISVLHDNVPITKLNPGERIHLYARAYKGVGETHAKFSPVATAFYRLVPKIQVDPDIPEKRKQLLVDTCPNKVFEIEESGDVAATNYRRCTTCRECTRTTRLTKYIKLEKDANHYEFTVESVGVRSAPELVKEAIKILRTKCYTMQNEIAETISK